MYDARVHEDCIPTVNEYFALLKLRYIAGFNFISWNYIGRSYTAVSLPWHAYCSQAGIHANREQRLPESVRLTLNTGRSPGAKTHPFPITPELPFLSGSQLIYALIATPPYIPPSCSVSVFLLLPGGYRTGYSPACHRSAAASSLIFMALLVMIVMLMSMLVDMLMLMLMMLMRKLIKTVKTVMVADGSTSFYYLCGAVMTI